MARRWPLQPWTFFLSERTLSYDSPELVSGTMHGLKYFHFVIPIAHILLRLLDGKSNFCNNKAMHKLEYEAYILYFPKSL